MSDQFEQIRKQVDSDRDYMAAFNGLDDDMVVADVRLYEYRRNVENAETLLRTVDRLRAGILKARDALDNYDYDTSLFAIIEELDDLLGDTDV